MNKLFQTITLARNDNIALTQEYRIVPGLEKSRVIVRDYVFQASIGVYESEKKAKQKVILNLELEVVPNPQWEKDSLQDVICYQKILEGVEDIATAGHIELLETLAEKIALFCLSDSRCLQATIRLEKPDIILNAAGVGVEIIRQRS